MDKGDLRAIFRLTAALTGLIALVSLPLSPGWSGRYLLIGTMALVNWIALAGVLASFTEKNHFSAAFALLMKPLLLVLLLVAGVNGLIEITSFLLGVNTFFISLFLYMGLKERLPRPFAGSRTALRGGLNAHG